MGRLFGTDGIRGKVHTYPITCDVALKIGRAVGLFIKQNHRSTVIIGKDTRASGDMLESALAAGIASTGVDAALAGVIPTPGVAYLSKAMDQAGAGIVISASHNPYYDNGIKIFRQGGVKLSDAQEELIESYILNGKDNSKGNPGKIFRIQDALNKYAKFLEGFVVSPPTVKLKLVIDASNGAASKISPMVFNKAHFETTFIHNTPNGVNINDNCGSQHTNDLKDKVLEKRADIGLGFDGDADRLIAVDEKGNELSGDRILAICAKFAKKNNRLKNNIVVSTTMSNLGLTKALKSLGISHATSDVGDRMVLEEMVKTGSVMGGEDSGHMIFLDDHTTGDGMLTALKLIEVMLKTGNSLSELAGVMKVYPQILRNVEVDSSRPDFNEIPKIADAIKKVESRLSGKGRVLVRYSGTQPLLRVMVEGPDKKQTSDFCDEICRAIKESI